MHMSVGKMTAYKNSVKSGKIVNDNEKKGFLFRSKNIRHIL